MTTTQARPFSGWRASGASRIALGLLVLLLALDLGFASGQLLLPMPEYGLWNLEADNGYPEKLQHLKWLAASVLLLALAIGRRAAIYFGWAALCLYFLVDDSISVHERAGIWLSNRFPLDRIHQLYSAWFPDMFLRRQDFGEMTVALIVATAIAGFLFLTWPPRDDIQERRVVKWLIGWLGLFALFAVGADMVHIMALDPVTGKFSPLGEALGFVEDGGEMICASLLVGGLALELERSRAVL